MLKFLLLVVSFPLWAAPVTPLVTGNGFGFGVVNLQSNQLTHFFVHPYKFTAMNPAQPYGTGYETSDLVSGFGWASSAAEVHYLEESHIVETDTAAGKYYFFMPFGYERPAVVAYNATGTDDCLNLGWAHPVQWTGSIQEGTRSALWFHFQDIPDSVLLVPTHDVSTLGPKCVKGSDGWVLIGLESDLDGEAALKALLKWQGQADAAGLVMKELNALEAWRVPTPAGFKSVDELKLWRQSETILRMGQSREVNRKGRYNHGMIMAALPDGNAPEGGWFMPWVRDMSYAALALIRMGHQDEAKWALEAYFNARPIGRVENMVRGYKYQISVVRYFGDGTEETDFGGENAPNVEFDNWGNVLNILAEYVDKFHDTSILKEKSVRGTVYVSTRDFVAKPLLGNVDKQGSGLILTKDTSIWEANAGSEQHFSYSTAAAIQGLRGLSRMAKIMKDSSEEKMLDAKVALLEKGFKSAFIPDGYIHGTLEDNPVYNVDSAVLEMFNFGVVLDKTVVKNTLVKMEELKMASGGYRRIKGDRNYDKQEFVFCDVNWARNYLRLGDEATASPMMKMVVDRTAGDNYFVPEMYVSEVNDEYPGAIGAPTGSVPMVGYGAGMAVIYFQERGALAR